MNGPPVLEGVTGDPRWHIVKSLNHPLVSSRNVRKNGLFGPSSECDCCALIEQ